MGAPKRKTLSVKDQRFVDYVIDHPDLSETQCAKDCGWSEGSVGKLFDRTRKEIDKRKRAISKKVDKEVAKKTVVNRLMIEQRALELAQMSPIRTKENINGQVNALRLLADMGGHIVSQTRDLTDELKGKTPEQLEYLAIHGYWPTSVGTGQSGATESESSSQSPSEPAKKPN